MKYLPTFFALLFSAGLTACPASKPNSQAVSQVPQIQASQTPAEPTPSASSLVQVSASPTQPSPSATASALPVESSTPTASAPLPSASPVLPIPTEAPPEPTPTPIPTANAASLAQVPTDGLIAYYPFDDDAQDASGNSHHGDIQGDIAFVDGYFKQAASFNYANENQYILVTHSEALALPQTLTLSAWAKTGQQDPDTVLPILSKGLNQENYTLWVAPTGPELLLNWLTEKEFWGHPEVESVKADEWHLYTVTYDGQAIKYYLDGIKQQQFAYSDTIDLSEEDLFIGQSPAGGVEHFDGLLDEVRIYNRALNDDEVKTLLLN